MKKFVFFSIFTFAGMFATEALAVKNIHPCSVYRDQCQVNGKPDVCNKLYTDALTSGYFHAVYFDAKKNQKVDNQIACKP